MSKAAGETVRDIDADRAGHRRSAQAPEPEAATRFTPVLDSPDRLIELHKVLDVAPISGDPAQINGSCDREQDLQLAMQCDLRVVAPDAFFQFPTSKYGLALDNWSIHRLSSLVGHGRARAMLLTAEKLTAETALQTGMANRIGTLADAQAWAAEIAGLAPLALAARQAGPER